MRTTKHLARRIISAAVTPAGYRVSGNHIFTARDYSAIERGAFRPAVLESETQHPPCIVRAARLLSRTY